MDIQIDHEGQKVHILSPMIKKSIEFIFIASAELPQKF